MQQPLPRCVQQRNASIQAGGDEAAVHGVDDVFVTACKLLEGAAVVLQFTSTWRSLWLRLLARYAIAHVGEQVDEDRSPAEL